MPTYDWNCEEHGTFEDTFKMSEKPKTIPCPQCGSPSPSLPSYGGIRSDEPAWLFKPETLGSLQKPNERPIESRAEYNRYLKTHGILERG